MCKYRNYSCNKCNVKGHLAAVCKKGNNNDHNSDKKTNSRGFRNNGNSSHNFMDEMDSVKDDFEGLFNLTEGKSIMKTRSVEPIKVKLSIQGVELLFELDTGLAVSAVSIESIQKMKELRKLNLIKTQRRFRSYQGDTMVPLGIIEVTVRYKSNKQMLELFVPRK